MNEVAGARARSKVLVVEDDPHVRFGMVLALRKAGFEIIEAETCESAIRRFRETSPDVVVSDLLLPDGNAVDLLPRLRAIDPSVGIFIVTGYGSIDVAVTAVKQGAEDFLTKPVDIARLVSLVGTSAGKRTAARSSRRQKFVPAYATLSDRMKQLEEQVEKLRDADCSVLLLGETGTGKSVLARRIHEIGARATGPFVDVNCAGLTREFVESELFGHERGAFTGAHAQKSGLFDAANRGTLFLDEIGDIDVQVQPKVLKVLEEKRFRRMGDVREREVDVRLVAATHRDMLAAVHQKTMRADLYYRISTVTLTIPPLRERSEDIPSLVRDIFAARSAAGVELDREAQEKLGGYAWPGNIRELKNVLERALLLRSGNVIRAVDIRFDATPSEPPFLAAPVSSLAAVADSEPSSAQESPGPQSSRLLVALASTATRGEIEREHIQLALAAENGRVEAAAKRMGMPRSTLYQKLKTYGITVTRSRGDRDDKRRGNGEA